MLTDKLSETSKLAITINYVAKGIAKVVPARDQ
jgi:hypothetical protein